MYGATKGAVEILTKMMSRELRGRNITINAIAPGSTATDLSLTGKTPDMIEIMAKAAPLERLGTPEDIANAMVFLIGPDGAWVNGQVLRVNGGLL